MHRHTLSLTVCLLAASAWAGTFELSDPANEMLEEQQAAAADEAGERALAPAGEGAGQAGMRCTLDIDDGLCFCNEKLTVHRLEMSQDACVQAIREALDTHHSAPGG